jgi:hypothetical protein
MAKRPKPGETVVTDTEISKVMRELGRRGGLKQVAKGFGVLTAEERKERAVAGAKARWAKKKPGAKVKR